MPAPISIVVPTLNAGDSLAGCAGALYEGLTEGLVRELIVTDGGSSDATEEVAEELGAVWLIGPASRGGQLRRGCEAAQGAWLLVVHADTQLAPGWTATVRDHLNAYPAPGRPAVFRLGFDARGVAPRLVAAWANLRTRAFRLPYGDQALLVPAALYRRAGGYPDIPLMEDVALIRRLPRPVLLPVTARTAARRYVAEGWCRRGARNLLTLLRWFGGADPHALARSYRRRDRSS